MVEEETKRGNSIAKGDDGRYYSSAIPSYLSKINRANRNEDTPDNFAERAKRDFGFAIENNVAFGFGDAVRREWATSSGLKRKIPFVGGLYAMEENLELIATVKRLQHNVYEQAYYDRVGEYSTDAMYASWTEEEIAADMGTKEQFIESFRQQDRDAISAHLKYITADKTAMAQIVEGVSVLPTWFVEFAATGGLASLGDDVAVKAGEKVLQGYAKTTAGKIALRTAGWTGGAFTRSFGLSTQVGEKYTKQTLDEVLGLKEESG